MHHTAIKDNKEACSVRALARRCTHIRQHTKNRNVFTCTYFDEVGMGLVTDDQIRFAVNFAAKALQYEKGASPSTGLTRIRCGQEEHAPSSWQDTMLLRSRSWGAGSLRVKSIHRPLIANDRQLSCYANAWIERKEYY